MESLIKAASDFLAAVLSTLGFVGRPRRRAGLRDDLQLLEQLRDSSDFGPGSTAHRFLVDHITLEVAKFSGVELVRKKKIPWGSVALSAVIGAPLGYWAFMLNQDGFQWISLLPGMVAGLMLLAVLGMLFAGDETPDDTSGTSSDGAAAATSTPTPIT